MITNDDSGLFSEPNKCPYLYVNPNNNKVHLLMPIISGNPIGLDNTCKAVRSLQDFFGKSNNPEKISAMQALNGYKSALEFDIGLFSNNDHSAIKLEKMERLSQINKYIEALEQVEHEPSVEALRTTYPIYPKPIQKLMQDERSNFYSIRLRPDIQDSLIRSINPTFSVDRTNDKSGTPNSLFYNALRRRLDDLIIKPNSTRERLINQVVTSAAARANDFEGIKKVLTEESKNYLGVTIDFTTPTKEQIQDILGDDLEAKDYIDGLLGLCAPDKFDSLIDEPFYMANDRDSLSLITQFFFGQINVYCASHGLTDANLGNILDYSNELSEQVVDCLCAAYVSEINIEDNLLEFVNEHWADFKLKGPLTESDALKIKTRFRSDYAQIKNSPHFDEFMLLDTEHPGLFVSHQNAIATDFAEFAHSADLKINSRFFKSIRDDYANLNKSIFIAPGIEPIKIEHLQSLVFNHRLETMLEGTQLKRIKFNLIKGKVEDELKSILAKKIRNESPSYTMVVKFIDYLYAIARDYDNTLTDVDKTHLRKAILELKNYSKDFITQHPKNHLEGKLTHDEYLQLCTNTLNQLKRYSFKRPAETSFEHIREVSRKFFNVADVLLSQSLKKQTAAEKSTWGAKTLTGKTHFFNEPDILNKTIDQYLKALNDDTPFPTNSPKNTKR